MNEPLYAAIWRGKANGSFRTYEVPRHDSQTVLDVVTYVQRHLDPTLAYRFACRVGMCGSCAMSVNGTPRWTCRTHVAKVVRGNTVRIAPLAHLPIIRDLVTDMREFFDKWTRAMWVDAYACARSRAMRAATPAIRRDRVRSGVRSNWRRPLQLPV